MAELKPDIPALKKVTRKVLGAWSGNRTIDSQIAYAIGMDWIEPGQLVSSWRQYVEENGFDEAHITGHVVNRVDGIPRFSTNMDVCFQLKWKLLPHHDFFDINGDPSGFGAEIGNWYLVTNEMHDYAKTEGATPELAFLGAILTAYLGLVTDTGVTKSMG